MRIWIAMKRSLKRLILFGHHLHRLAEIQLTWTGLSVRDSTEEVARQAKRECECFGVSK
jgi:hypothetical protein